MKDIQKKKRVSKKSKLSWRKHVDISDVENFLEDKRLEERLGKPVTEKTNQELFVIDNAPTTRKQTSSKQKKRMLLKKSIPKCYSMLQPHTEVPAITTKRPRLKTKSSLQDVIEKKLRKCVKKNQKLPIYNKAKLRSIKKLKNQKQKINFAIDMWNSEALNQVEGDWLHDDTKKHTLKGLGQYRIKIPHSIHTKSSVLPSIEAPHPGISYNPKFEDHQAILKDMVKREQDLIKEENHLNRVTTSMFKKTTAAKRDNNWIIEMSQGLLKEEEVESDTEYKAINPAVQNKKKDLKQRRRHREHQKSLGEIKSIRREKKKITDIHNLKTVKDEIYKQNKKTSLLQLKRLKKKEHTRLEPKRLSNRKFEEPEIVFNMPQNISGNLRNLKKEGSLLLDRFKSFERRNIIRPSAKHINKMGKFKKFVKSGHKEDWKMTVARPNMIQ